MSNMENIKKKHHFVFQAYLRSWKNINNEICVLRKKKKLFFTGTEAIAFKNSFYAINGINTDEKKLIDCYIAKMTPEVQEQLQVFIDAYLLPIENQKLLDKMKEIAKKKFASEETIRMEFLKEIEQLEQHISLQKNNTMEDLYSEIEGELVEYLNRIKTDGIKFYYDLDENKKFMFLYDVCVQYFRTVQLKELWIRNFGNSIKTCDFSKMEIDIEKVDLSKIVVFFFWEIQTLVAYSLMKKNAMITLLNNNTVIPFITSDQPIINLKYDYTNDLCKATELEFYYPISPMKALLINGEYSEQQIEVKENKVMEYNNAIAKASNQFLIGDNEAILQQFIKE